MVSVWILLCMMRKDSYKFEINNGLNKLKTIELSNYNFSRV